MWVWWKCEERYHSWALFYGAGIVLRCNQKGFCIWWSKLLLDISIEFVWAFSLVRWLCIYKPFFVSKFFCSCSGRLVSRGSCLLSGGIHLVGYKAACVTSLCYQVMSYIKLYAAPAIWSLFIRNIGLVIQLLPFNPTEIDEPFNKEVPTQVFLKLPAINYTCRRWNHLLHGLIYAFVSALRQLQK